MNTTENYSTQVNSSLMGKTLRFVSIREGAAREWENSEGIVTGVEAYNRCLVVRITKTYYEQKFVGIDTKWPIGDQWGYVLAEAPDWD